MLQKLLLWCTSNRALIIKLFQVFYFALAAFALFAAWVIFTENNLLLFVFKIGILLGQTAAILFLFITLPGILGRFGVRNPLITIGIMFRRYMGISMFLLGFFHGLIVYGLPTLATKQPFFPVQLFLVFGVLTVTLLFPLFLTSNNYSVQKLGKNWKRLHRLVYVIFWTIVFHIGLQGERGFTIAVAAIGILEIISLLYDYFKRRSAYEKTDAVQN